MIYTMGLALNRSTDGGRTFSRIGGMHGDHHGLWIDPVDTTVLYNVNDGGFYHSTDNGENWTFAVSAGGAQFYNVTIDNNSVFGVSGFGGIDIVANVDVAFLVTGLDVYGPRRQARSGSALHDLWRCARRRGP